MSKLVLIENLTPVQAQIVEESSMDGKEQYLSGIFMQADTKNGNQRVYPVHEIEKAVKFVQSKINEGQFIAGELNHPNDLAINLERVSHIITEIRMDGNNAVGKAKLLDTPMGTIAKNLIKGGLRLGVSSRGTGNVNESGEVSDFDFVTMDIVATPSAPDAYPEAITEALDLSKNGNEIVTLAEAVIHDDSAQKYLTKEINAFISSLMGK